MNDLLTAAKAVIDLYDYTGPADECEAANRLIAAVEQAERQEAVGVDGYLKKVQQNWGDVEVKPDHRALWTAAQQAERERIRAKAQTAAEKTWKAGEVYIGPPLIQLQKFVDRLLEDGDAAL